MDHTDNNLFVGQLGKTLFHSLHRSLYVSLDNKRKLFEIACLDLIKEIIQRKLAFCFLKKTVLVLRYKGSCKVFGLLVTWEGHQDLSCIWNVSQTQDLNRSGRTCLFYSASLIIHHCTYLAAACSCRNKVAYMKGSLLYQNCGNRTLALVKLSLDHKASCRTVGVCFQLAYFRRKKDHFQKSVNALSCVCGNRHKDSASAPVLRDQFILGKLLFYSFYVSAWLVDLVNGNNDLYACRFCMADGLYCLRHYTVVCRYNKNCDICCIGATHTHCCKCLMSRCIQESDLLTAVFYHVSTNVLCDSAGLSSCYICVTDSVKKRSFTMVNVTHNADYRRSGNHIGLILFLFFQKLPDHVYLFFRLCDNVIAQSNFLCLFKVDLMVYCYHGSFHKELFHNYRGLHFHSLCKLTDGHFLRKSDLLDLRLLLFLLRLRSRLLKGFRKSGHVSSSALIRSVSAALGFIKIFLFVFVFSVALSLAVLGSLCQLRSKYCVAVVSSSSRTLTGTVSASETVVSIRSALAAALRTSLASVVRRSSVSAAEITVSVTSVTIVVAASFPALSWLTVLVSSGSCLLLGRSVLSWILRCCFRCLCLLCRFFCRSLRLAFYCFSRFLWRCLCISRRFCRLRASCARFLILCLTFRSVFTSVAGILCVIHANNIFFLFGSLRFFCFRLRCYHLFFCSGIIHLGNLLLSPV